MVVSESLRRTEWKIEIMAKVKVREKASIKKRKGQRKETSFNIALLRMA